MFLVSSYIYRESMLLFFGQLYELNVFFNS